MDRKSFIKKGLLGTGVFVAGSSIADVVTNNIDELKELKPLLTPDTIGFNHIPNTNSKIMANVILHKSESRGEANHGWLKADTLLVLRTIITPNVCILEYYVY